MRPLIIESIFQTEHSTQLKVDKEIVVSLVIFSDPSLRLESFCSFDLLF